MSQEEERTLRNQTALFGIQSAEAGLPIVSNNLEKLVDLARNEKTPTFIPADFLESAATHLWETGTDIANIFDQYKKWFRKNEFDAETTMEFDTINELQSSFVNLAGKFTSQEESPIKQKQTLAKSIDFIDKNSLDQQTKAVYLMYYGKYLFEHGMEKEGRIIIKTTAKLAPKTVSKLLDLEAIFNQVRED